jgi:hypothetical protein
MHRQPSSEAEKSSTALTTVENTNGWLAVGERYLNPPVLFHSRKFGLLFEFSRVRKRATMLKFRLRAFAVDPAPANRAACYIGFMAAILTRSFHRRHLWAYG